MSSNYKLIGDLGNLIISLAFIIWFGTGIYAITIWWSVINEYGFWGLVGGIILFPITIILSPIYLGVEGNWEPTFWILFGLIAGLLVSFIGGRLVYFFGEDR